MEANGEEEIAEIKKDAAATTASSSSKRSRSRSRERGRDRDRDKDRNSGRSSRSRRSRSRSRIRSISRDYSAKRNDSSFANCTRVYVANIAFNCKWNELKDLFREKVGDVAYVELFSDENGKFRGCGIVELKDPALVRKAVDVLHRHDFKGRNLVIKEDYNVERDRYGYLRKGSSRGNDYDDQNNQRFRDGYRGDNFRGGRGGGPAGSGGGSNDGGGQNDAQYNNYGLNPDFLMSLGISGPLTSRVFVTNLEYRVDAKKLEDVFSCAGTVVNVDLKTDYDGNSKGIAVVEFAHPIEAVQAISMLNGQNLYTRTMNMRMDRFGENSDPSSKKLPTGLSGIGKGLGLDGQPLHLSRMNMNSVILPGGNAPNQMPGMGLAGANPVAAAAAAASGMALMGNPGMGNLASLNNLGSNSMSSLSSMNAANMGLGALGLGMSSLSSGTLGNSSADRSMMGTTMGGGMNNMSSLTSNPNLAGLSTSIGANLATLGQAASNLVMGSGGGNSASAMASLGMNLPSGVNNLMNSAGLGGTSSLGSLGLSQGGSANMMAASAMQNNQSNMSSSNNNNGQGFPNNQSNFDRGFDRSGNGDNYRSPRTSDTVAIRNLPNTLGWETVRERFREIGQIRFSEIKGRGSAVIRFSNEREAQRAVELMNGLRVDGRPIEVQLY